MSNQKLISKIKEFFTFEKPSGYIYECLNCEKKFDGTRVEYFIKHQIDNKHWDVTKYKKEDKKNDIS